MAITRPLARSERGTNFTLLHLVVNEMRGVIGVKRQQDVYEEKCMSDPTCSCLSGNFLGNAGELSKEQTSE